jgi:hypothetical protein
MTQWARVSTSHTAVGLPREGDPGLRKKVDFETLRLKGAACPHISPSETKTPRIYIVQRSSALKRRASSPISIAYSQFLLKIEAGTIRAGAEEEELIAVRTTGTPER